VTALVLPYTNPDLDGVACALSVQVLAPGNWLAGVTGGLDDETETVLELLGLAAPPPPPDWSGVDAIWLVDTHHLSQLPGDLPNERVVEVTDHHPGGNPERYPSASIQNEAVGAAATLVAERYLDPAGRIPPQIALLLQAAILSNTLEFRAPATSPRDHLAFAALKAIAELPVEVIDAMRQAKGARLRLETPALLESDLKVFDTRFGRVAIAQVEAAAALEVLRREDLATSLDALARSKNARTALVNLVDLAAGRGAILSTDSEIMQALARALGYALSDGALFADRLLQRKTDIVPHLA